MAQSETVERILDAAENCSQKKDLLKLHCG